MYGFPGSWLFLVVVSVWHSVRIRETRSLLDGSKKPSVGWNKMLQLLLLIPSAQVAISGLYVTAMWAMPHLTALASSNDKSSHPSFLITGGGLYKNPRVTHFLLAIMKSGQVSLTGSLAKEYGPKGVHVANVAVGGFVGPDKGIFSPAKIAEVYWRLYEQQESEWELVAHIGC